jgi:hypothetical protein
VIGLHAAACANEANPSEGPGNVTNRCDITRQIKSSKDIRYILKHNVFSFADSEITVNKPVEIFDEDGTYKIINATRSIVGYYIITNGVITIESPSQYFDMPLQRILIKSAAGGLIFCSSETGSRLPLAVITR